MQLPPPPTTHHPPPRIWSSGVAWAQRQPWSEVLGYLPNGGSVAEGRKELWSYQYLGSHKKAVHGKASYARNLLHIQIYTYIYIYFYNIYIYMYLYIYIYMSIYICIYIYIYIFVVCPKIENSFGGDPKVSGMSVASRLFATIVGNQGLFTLLFGKLEGSQLLLFFISFGGLSLTHTPYEPCPFHSGQPGFSWLDAIDYKGTFLLPRGFPQPQKVATY